MYPPEGESYRYTSSWEGSCREILVNYNPGIEQSTVTSTAGTTTVDYSLIGESFEPESVSGAGCTACGTGGRTMDYAYDMVHNLTSQTDGNGIITSYTSFNTSGMPGSIIRGPRTVALSYDSSFPDLVESVLVNGANERQFSYDEDGNLTEARLGAAGPATTYTYNGRPFRLTDVAGRVIREIVA